MKPVEPFRKSCSCMCAAVLLAVAISVAHRYTMMGIVSVRTIMNPEMADTLRDSCSWNGMGSTGLSITTLPMRYIAN